VVRVAVRELSIRRRPGGRTRVRAVAHSSPLLPVGPTVHRAGATRRPAALEMRGATSTTITSVSSVIRYLCGLVVKVSK